MANAATDQGQKMNLPQDPIKYLGWRLFLLLRRLAMGVTKRLDSEIKRRAGSERACRILVYCNRRFLVGDFHGFYKHAMRTAVSELRARSLLPR